MIRGVVGLLFNEICKSNAIYRTSHQSEINVARERGIAYLYTVTAKWNGYIIDVTMYVHTSKPPVWEKRVSNEIRRFYTSHFIIRFLSGSLMHITRKIRHL